MTISASIVFEVQNGGSDNNGGGFKTGAVGGTDWSTATTAHATTTTASTVNATTTRITVAAANYTVATTDVGNCVNITGGTATAGLYEITGVVTGAGQYWQLDRSCGTAGQTVVSSMGGCFATPGKAGAVMTVTGHRAWVKYNATDYTITTATPGAAGPVTLGNVGVWMAGYDQTRGDDTGNRPCLNWGAVAAPGGVTYLYLATTAVTQSFINLKANGNSVNNVAGFFGASQTVIHNCHVIECDGTAGIGVTIGTATGATLIGTLVSNCTTGISVTGGGTVKRCAVTACVTGISIATTTGACCEGCIVYACTGVGYTSSVTSWFDNCVSYGNTSDGFATTSSAITLVNCVFVLNGGYGVNEGTTLKLRLIKCFDYTNTLGRTNAAPFVDYQPTNLTGDPFTSSTDFRPNNTAGAGASLRAAGILIQGQTNNNDAGSMQHADPSGGGILVNPGTQGGINQ